MCKTPAVLTRPHWSLVFFFSEQNGGKRRNKNYTTWPSLPNASWRGVFGIFFGPNTLEVTDGTLHSPKTNTVWETPPFSVGNTSYIFIHGVLGKFAMIVFGEKNPIFSWPVLYLTSFSGPSDRPSVVSIFFLKIEAFSFPMKYISRRKKRKISGCVWTCNNEDTLVCPWKLETRKLVYFTYLRDLQPTYL